MDCLEFKEYTVAPAGVSAITLGREGVVGLHRLYLGTRTEIQLC